MRQKKRLCLGDWLICKSVYHHMELGPGVGDRAIPRIEIDDDVFSARPRRQDFDNAA